MKTKTFAEILIRRIDELLFKTDKSLYQFTKENGISKSTLMNLRNGHVKNPSIKLIAEIAAGFDMTIADFLRFDEIEQSLIR